MNRSLIIAALILAAGVVASALVHRYDVAAAPGGAVVIDRLTGTTCYPTTRQCLRFDELGDSH